MNLAAMGDARRAQRGFPSADHGLANGDGKKEIGFADIVVVEEIHDVGAEVIGVEDPSAKGDGHAELMLFVALAVERNESQIVGIGKMQQRPGSGDQRRRLIIVAIESAESPVEMRNVERGAEARADGILR